MDLVAHMLLKKVAQNGGPNLLGDSALPDDFTFELHTRFPDKKEALGLELINLLAELSADDGSFVHHGRLSSIPE